MSDKERLGREGIGLYVDIGTSDLVHETRLANVGETAHENGAVLGSRAGRRDMCLRTSSKIGKGGFLALEDGTHATECSALETLAAVERVAVLDHANHVASNRVDKRPGGVDLTKSELVMITIIESVTQVSIERMDVVETRESHSGSCPDVPKWSAA